MSLFLGIDTSNYTTSVALFDSLTGEIAQKKKLLPVREGQLGLRQSDAVFHHTAQLHTLFGELHEGVNPREISAIGVSTRPRPVDGSYMPCFTVGENTAKILSAVLRVPLFVFSHQEGHIAAALYSAKRDDLFDKDFLAFHVSGGTTEAVIAKGDGYGFSVDIVAKTLDLNAGQAVDRVGLMLGLRFPCGMELERLAEQNTELIKVRPTLKGCDCCLSGVENRCKKLLDSGKSREYVAAFCIESIRVTLCAMTDAIFEKYGSMPVVYAGGVMSNKIIKNSFEEKYNAVFAEPVFSSDNAAGIAYLCYRAFENVYI
ncbi:MAG: peptidase M22 [Ruminococcus sp.]|nr:peptidase M22 [Ruminococcus sp.]